jgi:hypothetical protein
MLPQFYHSCLNNYLSESQQLTWEILLWLLQVHKQVKIERLAALFPVPILYESRRRHIQRFLLLPNLSLPLIWFPLIKYRYILTNLNAIDDVIQVYKARSGIEALFKDCKTGGYNLEGTKASTERLNRLVLLIAIAYTLSSLQGNTTRCSNQ